MSRKINPIFLFLSLFLFFASHRSHSQQSLSLPLKEIRVNCGFGYRIHPITGNRDDHKGVDLQAWAEPVFAILEGKVLACGYDPILGNYVKLSHGELMSIYGHLSYILTVKGQLVGAGDCIGISGNTGRSTGEHLHFSLKMGKVYINPVAFFYQYFSSRSP